VIPHSSNDPSQQEGAEEFQSDDEEEDDEELEHVVTPQCAQHASMCPTQPTASSIQKNGIVQEGTVANASSTNTLPRTISKIQPSIGNVRKFLKQWNAHYDPSPPAHGFNTAPPPSRPAEFSSHDAQATSSAAASSTASYVNASMMSSMVSDSLLKCDVVNSDDSISVPKTDGRHGRGTFAR
jgi:hypothetical protein